MIATTGTFLVGAGASSGQVEGRSHAIGNKISKSGNASMGTFFVVGYFKDEVIRSFAHDGVAGLHDRLDGIARKIGGNLVELFLVGGTWKMEALFAAPPEISSDLVYLLLASGIFESDFRLGRNLSATELDRAMGAFGTAGQPWTGAPL